MTILITGGTGFLGQALVRRASAGSDASIRLLAREPRNVRGLDTSGIEVVRGDLRDPASLDAAVQGVDLVFHLATTRSGTWDEYYQATVQGTERLVRAAARAGVRRFVYVSSIYVVDIFGNRDVVDESCPYRDRYLNNYIRSKILAEKRLRSEVGKSELEILVARPGQLFGPGAPCPLEVGFRVGADRVVIPARDFAIPVCYVDHAVSALRLLGERGVNGEIYHVLDDEPIRKLQYLQLLREHSNARLRILRMPYPMVNAVHLAAALLSRVHPVARNIHRRTSLLMTLLQRSSDLCYPNTKLKQLGWRQSVPTEVALTQTICSYRRNEGHAQLARHAA
jgi:2-alkyl-3-oxoalkanoate reductase